jgi:glycosyltransferase involved in cell wall biosynthesis
VVTVCGLDWQRTKWSGAAKAAIRAAEWAGTRSASATIVLSKKIQTYFQDTYKVETTRIPNGIECKPKVEATDQIEALGLTQGSYVLFAARLVHEKGAHDLIAAWKRVATDKKLVIAGGGRYDDDYVRQLRGMAEPDRVLFTGHVSGELLEQLFAHAYLFVLPSYIEGLSIALLESIAHRRAALVSDIPENVEVIEENGFQFAVGNVQDLAAKLAWLIADEDAVKAMEAQLARVGGVLPTWPEVARQHAEVYRDVVQGERQNRSRVVPNQPAEAAVLEKQGSL